MQSNVPAPLSKKDRKRMEATLHNANYQLNKNNEAMRQQIERDARLDILDARQLADTPKPLSE